MKRFFQFCAYSAHFSTCHEAIPDVVTADVKMSCKCKASSGPDCSCANILYKDDCDMQPFLCDWSPTIKPAPDRMPGYCCMDVATNSDFFGYNVSSEDGQK